MSDALFGELRGLLHEPFDDEGWSIRRVRFTDKDPKAGWLSRLRTLLRSTYRAYPDVYTETWLPYLRDFDAMWRIRTLSAETFAQLVDEQRWLPFAYYEMWVHHRWSHLSDRDHSFSSEALSRVVGLSLSYSRCEDDGVEWLVRHEHLHHVTNLYFHQCDLSPRSLGHLARASNLGAVTGLHMSDNHTGYWDERLTPLIDSEFLARLEHLGLSDNTLHAEDLKPFVASPSVRNLQTLRLAENDLGDEGLEILAGSQNLAALRVLSLNECNATDAGLTAIARSPHLKNLRHLFLHGNTLTDAGAIQLAESPNLATLESLSLPRGLGDEAREALRTSEHLSEEIRAGFA